MSDHTPHMAFKPAQTSKIPKTLRTVVALMLREMSTTYGRSVLGYFWAILEPVAGIMLMTFIFSLAFRTPSLGTSYPLFFASGMLPFMAYLDTSNKVSVALRFSKALLSYPGVTFVDALLGRILLSAMTQTMVAALVLAGILQLYSLDVILDLPAIAMGFLMALCLAVGIGTLNCFLLSVFPVWERAWAVLTRPLFIISAIIFLYDVIPQPYRDWLWWNPIIHVVGKTRQGIYATYDAAYVSPLYVFTVSGITLCVGLLLLRRYHRDILNF